HVGSSARSLHDALPSSTGQEDGGRIGHLAQAAVGHGKDAQLVHRPEAVLEGAQDAIAAAGLALEVQHRIDHVLEHARTGYAPFLDRKSTRLNSSHVKIS